MDNSFEIIFIMLGDACNFKCKYCLQGDHNLKIIQPKLSKEMLGFLDSYSSENKTMISFWGGEPLLYFDSIKKIVERYQDKFNYEMVSNGSLLTEEIVCFLNKYKIGYHLSHDGSITEYTRNVDILKNEKLRDLFDRINHKSVNITITSISPSMQDLFQYYSDDYLISINTMINTTDTPISRAFADFDYKKYKKDMQYLFDSYEQYLLGDISRHREANTVARFMGSLQAFLNEGRVRNRCFACGHGKKMLNMDCNGSFYLCHNSCVKIGSVEEGYDIASEKLDKILEKHTAKCRECEIKDVCAGNCFMLNGYGEEQSCELLKQYYGLFLPWLIEMKNKYEGRDNEQNTL